MSLEITAFRGWMAKAELSPSVRRQAQICDLHLQCLARNRGAPVLVELAVAAFAKLEAMRGHQ